MTVKKRKGWYRTIKPIAPLAPRKPDTNIVLTECTVIHTSCSSVSLSDLKIPEGRSLADVRVRGDADSDGDVSLEFFIVDEVTQPNPRYDQYLKSWEKEYEKWKVRKEEFKAEMLEWHQWCKEQDEADLQKSLTSAASLLKKHGRL